MKNIVAGILAHVDSGKTTLSEALSGRTDKKAWAGGSSGYISRYGQSGKGQGDHDIFQAGGAYIW